MKNNQTQQPTLTLAWAPRELAADVDRDDDAGNAAPQEVTPSQYSREAFVEAFSAHIDHIGRIERAYRRGKTQGRIAVIRTINDWFLRGQDQASDDARRITDAKVD